MTFRGWMAGVDRANCLAGAQALWSMWRGYPVDQPSGVRLQGWLAEHGIPLTHIHASGHATVADLQRLAEAFQPATVVPIHTNHPELFPGLFPNVVLHDDGEWWRV